MVSPLVSRAPQCLSCVRRIAGRLGDAFQFPAGQQVRGKKKIAKVETVNVQLRRDMAGYGSKGDVTSVIAGRMRNIWYPNQFARYLTAELLQKLQLKRNVVAERDFAAKSHRRKVKDLKEAEAKEREERRLRREAALKAEREAAERQRIQETTNEYQYLEILNPQERKASVALDLLSPSEATEILKALAPPYLEFFPPTMTVPQRPGSSRSVPLGEDAQGPEPEPQRVALYGSVTTNDVAINLRTVLSADPQGARVVISAKNITFVDDLPEKDRVKHLGEYEFDILLDGATEPVRRSIRVTAEDMKG